MEFDIVGTDNEAVLYTGDSMDVLKELDSNSIDSIVTDPPYGLSFMGKAWDKSVPSAEMWKEALRVLKPGGHLLCFAGTRTHHRMATNIEDAGFEIRDMIAWVYGSGFPKSLDVSKAIDKAAGAEREVVGSKLGRPGMSKDGGNQRNGFDHAYGGEKSGPMPTDITAPATPEAQQWDGWGTALKPALEPITVARKPLTGTVAANVLEWGTGAINVDGCRVGTESGLQRPERRGKGQTGGWANYEQAPGNYGTPDGQGRWPSNFAHDGSDEVVRLFPVTTSGAVRNLTNNGANQPINMGGGMLKPTKGSTGSAARFFYCAKTSKRDRDEGCEALELRQPVGGADKWTEQDRRRGEGVTRQPTHNNHPTVKPTDLMRYLVRLVTPPGGTVLDPFMGSGSTGKGAILEGFKFKGIDIDPESVKISKARCQWALDNKDKITEESKSKKPKKTDNSKKDEPKVKGIDEWL